MAHLQKFLERAFSRQAQGRTEFDWGIEDIPMDFDSLLVGSMSGSGGVIIMDDSTDMVEALANINYFYAHERASVHLAEKGFRG